MCNNDHFISKDPQYRTRIKWNDLLRNDFRLNLIARLTDLNTAVSQTDISDRHSIDSCVENISTILHEAASPLFSKNICINPPNTPCSSQNKISKKADWFDDDCRTAKQLYLNALNGFNRCKSEDNRNNMCYLKCSYKHLVKKKKKSEFLKIIRLERLRA